MRIAGAVTTPFEEFVESLRPHIAEDVFNPWGERFTEFTDFGGPEGRRDRLVAHLSCSPKVILLGEAVGYRGAATSGIPFTSEKLLCKGSIPRIEMTPRLSSRQLPWAEPSATIVWGSLHELGIAEETVLWNAFPYHPHNPGREHSNRTPTQDELEFGAKWLKRLLDLNPQARVIAVGKNAERALEHLEIQYEMAIRHPANGGATEFREGMRKLFRRR